MHASRNPDQGQEHAKKVHIKRQAAIAQFAQLVHIAQEMKKNTIVQRILNKVKALVQVIKNVVQLALHVH